MRNTVTETRATMRDGEPCMVYATVHGSIARALAKEYGKSLVALTGVPCRWAFRHDAYERFVAAAIRAGVEVENELADVA